MTKRKKPRAKPLNETLAEHPGATLATLLIGVAGLSGAASYATGRVQEGWECQERERETQQQILDLKNAAHTKEVELLNARAEQQRQIQFAQFYTSEAGTGNTLQMTEDIEPTE